MVIGNVLHVCVDGGAVVEGLEALCACKNGGVYTATHVDTGMKQCSSHLGALSEIAYVCCNGRYTFTLSLVTIYIFPSPISS